MNYKNAYSSFWTSFKIGLIFGCLVAAIICWTNVVVLMINNDEPLSFFFRYRHLNHQFTEVIDVHPSYLSLFTITSIFILLNDLNKLKGKGFRVLITFIIVLLSLFLISLLARLLLSFYLVSIFAYFIVKKNWLGLSSIVTLIIAFIFVIVFIKDENEYLRKKYFTEISSVISNKQNTRFNRLKATKYMFGSSPLFGVGTSDSQEYRQQYYLETNDRIAYHERYNAHNQFFEYLDQQGLIGGVCYLMFFIFSFRKGFKQKDYLLMYITILFFVSNLTESMLQRTHGIVFYSFVFTFLYLRNDFLRNQNTPSGV